MAKKLKRQRTVLQSSLQLKGRVHRAMTEGRWQQALELGKELYRQEATPAHREQLLKIYLGRARQLRNQGHTRDAHTVLKNAVALAGNEAVWLEPIAEELAMVGQATEAQELIARVPNSPLQAKVLNRAADSALSQGPRGREQVPAPLQAGFDAVMEAFTHVAAGRDDAVRETLQAIGLQSPFLEWKLLLRGFLAYYQNDDTRAVENWGRLSPDRVPARLAAPFRFRIDPAFRLAQPPEMQPVLQRQADRLQGSGLVPPLRALQVALSQEELAPAFRQAGNLLPALRQEAPQHVSRLAACFHWAIIHHGEAPDVDRYQRLFGAPADDPELARLEALALETRGDWDEANNYWRKFEQSVADHPAVWSGQANQVRALVWCHMGKQAAVVEEEERPSRRRGHKPTSRAEGYFRRALELSPDQREPYEALFHYYRDKEMSDQAVEIAQQLLQRFPDHLPTLEALGKLYLEIGRYADGLDLLRRALRTNPLDRDLRAEVSRAHTLTAREHGEAGRFDEARAEFQAALATWEGKERFMPLSKWAACEFKADNAARAEELLAEARAEAGRSLAIGYLMAMEAVRFKLSRPLKKRFEDDFAAALTSPPLAEEAVAALETAAAHRHAEISYRGQKSHEKKMLDYLGRVAKASFTEEQLEQLCQAFLLMKDMTALRKYTDLGRKRFRRNPHFPFLEAQSYVSGKRRTPPWEMSGLLAEAERLAEALPQDERIRKLLDAIRQQREALGFMANPFGMLGNMFRGVFDEDDFDDEDDSDSYW